MIEPRWDRMPPCGWHPLVYEHGGHLWIEQYSGSRMRRFVCSRCRKLVVLTSSEDVTTALGAQSPCKARKTSATPPGTARQAWNYTKAVARWIAAGRPVRSDSRVQEIFETLCQPCEHFDAEHQSCRLCGCRVRKSGSAFANKLRMATERCPMQPPKWVEEVSQQEQ